MNEDEMFHVGYQHGYDGEDFAFDDVPAYADGFDQGVTDAAINYHIVFGA